MRKQRGLCPQPKKSEVGGRIPRARRGSLGENSESSPNRSPYRVRAPPRGVRRDAAAAFGVLQPRFAIRQCPDQCHPLCVGDEPRSPNPVATSAEINLDSATGSASGARLPQGDYRTRTQDPGISLDIEVANARAGRGGDGRRFGINYDLGGRGRPPSSGLDTNHGEVRIQLAPTSVAIGERRVLRPRREPCREPCREGRGKEKQGRAGMGLPVPRARDSIREGSRQGSRQGYRRGTDVDRATSQPFVVWGLGWFGSKRKHRQVPPGTG